jgi:hypothetical protein
MSRLGTARSPVPRHAPPRTRVDPYNDLTSADHGSIMAALAAERSDAASRAEAARGAGALLRQVGVGAGGGGSNGAGPSRYLASLAAAQQQQPQRGAGESASTPRSQLSRLREVMAVVSGGGGGGKHGPSDDDSDSGALRLPLRRRHAASASASRAPGLASASPSRADFLSAFGGRRDSSGAAGGDSFDVDTPASSVGRDGDADLDVAPQHRHAHHRHRDGIGGGNTTAQRNNNNNSPSPAIAGRGGGGDGGGGGHPHFSATSALSGAGAGAGAGLNSDVAQRFLRDVQTLRDSISRLETHLVGDMKRRAEAHAALQRTVEIRVREIAETSEKRGQERLVKLHHTLDALTQRTAVLEGALAAEREKNARLVQELRFHAMRGVQDVRQQLESERSARSERIAAASGRFADDLYRVEEQLAVARRARETLSDEVRESVERAMTARADAEDKALRQLVADVRAAQAQLAEERTEREAGEEQLAGAMADLASHLSSL